MSERACAVALVALVAVACGGDRSAEPAPPAPAFPLPVPVALPVPVGDATLDQSGLFHKRADSIPVRPLLALAGRDPETGDLGYAVLSAAPAAGTWVGRATAETGVVLVGRRADRARHESVLGMLAAGRSPTEVIAGLVEEGGDRSQVAVLAGAGLPASVTGSRVPGAAVGASRCVGGDDCVLVTTLIPHDALAPGAMLEAFAAGGGLPLPERLLLALRAGWRAGPDLEAASAALVVVRAKGGPGGVGDRLVDLRVDLSREAVPRLIVAYEAFARAVLGAQLLTMQRTLATTSPIYTSNRRWVARLSRGAPLGER